MNIALVGYGKMGQVVHKVARDKTISITRIIDPKHPDADFQEINAESLKDIDVCIDFTHPDVAVENIKKIAKEGKNIVMATTGWLDEIEEVKKIVEDNKIGFLYASNFSLGVNIFFKLVREAAQMMNKFDDYDVLVHEIHHDQKKDAPSGTALSIGDILLEKIERKSKLALDKPEGEIKKDEISITSVRDGDIPGTHGVSFDSPVDTIELKHTAHNREGFALGSLVAAQWLNGKKGFFTVEDWMGE